MNTGLLLARLVVGSLMAAHGAQKLFGWFGGHGLAAVSGMFEALGFRPARVFAALASVAEVVSGVLVAAGLFGPVGPALMLAVMIVAAMSVHWPNGLFAMSNGIEVPLLYGAGAAGLALTARPLLARRPAGPRRRLDAGAQHARAGHRGALGNRKPGAPPATGARLNGIVHL